MKNLILEKDAWAATIDEVLVRPETIRDTPTYTPVYNDELLNMIHDVAKGHDLNLVNPEFGLSKDRQKMFGVYEVEGQDHLRNTVKLILGIRNSFDGSLSAGICFGSKVIVCSNLAFSGYAGENGIVGKVQHKHTTNIETTLFQRLKEAFSQFSLFKEFQNNFYDGLGARYVDDTVAYATIVRAVRGNAIPNKDVVKVADAWLESGNPEYSDNENWHQEFTGRNAWSLFNIFTENHKQYTRTNRITANKRSINLTKLFCQEFMN